MKSLELTLTIEPRDEGWMCSTKHPNDEWLFSLAYGSTPQESFRRWVESIADPNVTFWSKLE